MSQDPIQPDAEECGSDFEWVNEWAAASAQAGRGAAPIPVVEVVPAPPAVESPASHIEETGTPAAAEAEVIPLAPSFPKTDEPTVADHEARAARSLSDLAIGEVAPPAVLVSSPSEAEQPHTSAGTVVALAPVAFRVVAADQLNRDIAEIERARAALCREVICHPAVPRPTTPARQQMMTVQQRPVFAFTVVPSRTADSVPLVVGGVLAMVMLVVFGAVASFVKLGR